MPLEWLCRSALPVHSWGCLAWIQLQPFHKQEVWTLNAICKHGQTPPPACLQATRCGQEWHKLHTKYTFDVELKACSHGAWTARRPPPCWLPLQECGCNHRPRKANTLHSSPGREGKQVASPHTRPADTRHAPSPHLPARPLSGPQGQPQIRARVKFSMQLPEPTGQEKQSKAGEFLNWACKAQGEETLLGLGSSHSPRQEQLCTLAWEGIFPDFSYKTRGKYNTENSWAKEAGLNKKSTLGNGDAWKDPGLFLSLGNHPTLSQVPSLGWRHFFITPKSFCKHLSPLPTHTDLTFTVQHSSTTALTLGHFSDQEKKNLMYKYPRHQVTFYLRTSSF